MLIYRVSDVRTDRRATVELDPGVIGTRGRVLPYLAAFYEHGALDHTRRYSSAGLAEGAADEWCDGMTPLHLGVVRHHRSPRPHA